MVGGGPQGRGLRYRRPQVSVGLVSCRTIYRAEACAIGMANEKAAMMTYDSRVSLGSAVVAWVTGRRPTQPSAVLSLRKGLDDV